MPDIHRIVFQILRISGIVVSSRRISLFGFWRQWVSNCAMKLSAGKFAAYLQLLHPVLTLGRLALLAFSLAILALPGSIVLLFRPYALLASRPSLARSSLVSSFVSTSAVVYRVHELLISETSGCPRHGSSDHSEELRRGRYRVTQRQKVRRS